ncbi:MAG: CoA-binding protein [Bacteroidetes bacterium]|nr:CoA-binding protein [Bacteroidota bacterium]
MNKKTVVLGASENPTRYSFLATIKLLQKGIEVVPIGLRKGSIQGIEILTGQPKIENVHTVTLYLRAELQQPLYNYLISLHPSRIIFNPGTENTELERLAQQNGIETTNACTIVMLSIGDY